MEIKKILVSQPYPSSERSPYFDLQRRYGLELTFNPLIRVESLTPKEFRTQKLILAEYTAVVFTSRTAADHFFKLIGEMRMKLSEELHFFCLNETIALYLQNYTVYRKRKVHYSKVGKVDDLVAVMKKHNKEKFLMPVADVHKEEDYAIYNKGKLHVTLAVMYRTVSVSISPEEIASYDMLIFFTPAGIKSLYDNVPDYKQGDQLIGLFGPSTHKAAEEAGLRIDACGPTPELTSMAAVLGNYLAEHQE